MKHVLATSHKHSAIVKCLKSCSEMDMLEIAKNKCLIGGVTSGNVCGFKRWGVKRFEENLPNPDYIMKANTLQA